MLKMEIRFVFYRIPFLVQIYMDLEYLLDNTQIKAQYCNTH